MYDHSKRKLGLDPNNTKWSRNTDTFGQRMLRAQGWEPGQYLGAKDAAHAEWHTAASSTHIQVTLKDDNLGLGAKRNTGDECVGLDAFQMLLGRLNGKSEEVLETEQKARDDVKRNLYVEQKIGVIRFVRGGWLVGDQLKENPDDRDEEPKSAALPDATAADSSVDRVASDSAETKSEKKSKKRKADEESDREEKGSKKNKKSKKRKAETEEEGESEKSRLKRKEKKSKKQKKQKNGGDGDSTEESGESTSVQASADEEAAAKKAAKKERKREKKEKKEKKERKAEKKKRRKEEASSDSDSDSEDKKSKKKKRRKGESGSASATEANGTSGISTPSGSGYSTPIPTGSSRYLSRQRFIEQKKMAFADSAALNQVSLSIHPRVLSLPDKRC